MDSRLVCVTSNAEFISLENIPLGSLSKLQMASPQMITSVMQNSKLRKFRANTNRAPVIKSKSWRQKSDTMTMFSLLLDASGLLHFFRANFTELSSSTTKVIAQSCRDFASLRQRSNSHVFALLTASAIHLVDVSSTRMTCLHKLDLNFVGFSITMSSPIVECEESESQTALDDDDDDDPFQEPLDEWAHILTVKEVSALEVRIHMFTAVGIRAVGMLVALGPVPQLATKVDSHLDTAINRQTPDMHTMFVSNTSGGDGGGGGDADFIDQEVENGVQLCGYRPSIDMKEFVVGMVKGMTLFCRSPDTDTSAPGPDLLAALEGSGNPFIRSLARILGCIVAQNLLSNSANEDTQKHPSSAKSSASQSSRSRGGVGGGNLSADLSMEEITSQLESIGVKSAEDDGAGAGAGAGEERECSPPVGSGQAPHGGETKLDSLMTTGLQLLSGGSHTPDLTPNAILALVFVLLQVRSPTIGFVDRIAESAQVGHGNLHKHIYPCYLPTLCTSGLQGGG